MRAFGRVEYFINDRIVSGLTKASFIPETRKTNHYEFVDIPFRPDTFLTPSYDSCFRAAQKLFFYAGSDISVSGIDRRSSKQY